MAWTYSGNPAASDLDLVRYKIGDINTDDQLLADAEIAYELTLSTDISTVIISCVRAVLRKLSLTATDKKVGPASLRRSQKFEQYKALLLQFLDEQSNASISSAPAMVTPHNAAFDIGITDYPGTEQEADTIGSSS